LEIGSKPLDSDFFLWNQGAFQNGKPLLFGEKEMQPNKKLLRAAKKYNAWYKALSKEEKERMEKDTQELMEWFKREHARNKRLGPKYGKSKNHRR